MSSQTATAEQINVMLDFMEKHLDLARGIGSCSTKHIKQNLWKDLTQQLNNVNGGAQKSVSKWQKVWLDRKHIAKKMIGISWKSLSCPDEVLANVPLDYVSLRIVNLMKKSLESAGDNTTPDIFDDKDECTQFETFQLEGNYKKVRGCFIKLVKDYGISVSILDVQPLQDIIDLIPMRLEERCRITAAEINKYLENKNHEDTGLIDEYTGINDEYTGLNDEYTGLKDDENDLDRSESDEQIIEVHSYDQDQINDIKSNKQTNCTCIKNPKNPKRDQDCRANREYFHYFDINSGVTMCNFCGEIINWTNTNKLKRHLLDQHPNIKFEEHNSAVFESSITIKKDVDEIFLEDDNILPLKKKREESRIECDKEIRTNIETDTYDCVSERSLEKFGQYVAALLTSIPRDRSLKLQMQIIQKLMKEQAEAG